MSLFPTFHRLAAVGCGVCLSIAASAQQDVRIDAARLNATMERMKGFGHTAYGGSMRVAYSEANREALGYIAELMGEAGLTTRIDAAGNLIGSRPGSSPALAPLMTGSHIDTVPNGGHYDGVVGAMAAVEVARSLYEAPSRSRNSTCPAWVTGPWGRVCVSSVVIPTPSTQWNAPPVKPRAISSCTSSRAPYWTAGGSISVSCRASSGSGAGTLPSRA